MKTLGLFVFIDALGWAILQRHPEFLADLAPHRQPLETILGYSSACDPSIISGLRPCEHKLWSSYYYDPAGSPFRGLKAFRFLPAALTDRARVRHYLSRFVARAWKIRGYFQLYNVPFALLPEFSYAEWKRIWEPGGLPAGTSIFDLMQEAGVPWHVHDSGKNDDGKIADLRATLDQGRVRLAYTSLGRLDALMHAEGTRSPRVTATIAAYHRTLHDLLDVARRRYEQVRLFVFTDHGMHDVQRGYDLAADIARLGLRFGVDYAVFYDSTMARFWTLRPEAGRTLRDFLGRHPEGRIVEEPELRQLGVFFPDAQYGDLVFLMHSGVQIAPSFMGRRAIRGMHGFHPSDDDSRAMICANEPLPPSLTRIEQIFGYLCQAAGIPLPAGRAAP